MVILAKKITTFSLHLNPIKKTVLGEETCCERSRLVYIHLNLNGWEPVLSGCENRHRGCDAIQRVMKRPRRRLFHYSQLEREQHCFLFSLNEDVCDDVIFDGLSSWNPEAREVFRASSMSLNFSNVVSAIRINFPIYFHAWGPLESFNLIIRTQKKP